MSLNLFIFLQSPTFRQEKEGSYPMIIMFVKQMFCKYIFDTPYSPKIRDQTFVWSKYFLKYTLKHLLNKILI